MVLVAKDKSWVICMPKKTASQSIVGMCEQVGIAKVVGEYHGYIWDGSGTRYMIIRNPKERLSSMYWFSRKEHSFCYGSGFGNEWLQRFAELLNNKQLNEWTITQSEMAAHFKPNKVFKLESELQELLDTIGLKIPIQYRNVTKDKNNHRLSFNDTFTIIPAEINEWLIKDAGDWY